MRPLLRIFSADKTIDSRLLNRLGVQPLRAIAARALYKMAPVKVPTDIVDKYKELQQNGYAMWPNFLPADQFAKLKAEVQNVFQKKHPKTASRQAGKNTFSTLYLSQAANELPETKRFNDHPTIKAIMEAATKTDLNELYCHYEYLVQGTHPQGDDDPYADMLHSDYFANTYKAWLFLTDAKMENGPFAFAKGSQSLSIKRLGWLYQDSVNENSGSLRFRSHEVAGSGLDEHAVECPANTFIVVNTHGFHRRLAGKTGSERLSIGFGARVNPFLTYVMPDFILKTLKTGKVVVE